MKRRCRRCLVAHASTQTHLVVACRQWLAPQHRQPALQDEPVHSLPAAVGCQQVRVCRAEARLPCCRKGWACGSEFEALSTGVGRAWDVWLELQHEGPMVAGYLAHARLTALL